MAKFIKLTSLDRELATIVAVDQIALAYAIEIDHTRVFLKRAGSSHYADVTETPEQILALIEAAGGV